MKMKYRGRRKDPNFVPSTFTIHVLETPGVTLTFSGYGRKVAIDRAMRAAPGCTFRVEEKKR